MMNFGSAADIWWQGETACIWIGYNGKKILCRISREAIDDHFGNPDSDEARLDAAKESYHGRIEDVIGQILLAHRFEPDGSILIRTADL